MPLTELDMTVLKTGRHRGALAGFGCHRYIPFAALCGSCQQGKPQADASGCARCYEGIVRAGNFFGRHAPAVVRDHDFQPIIAQCFLNPDLNTICSGRYAVFSDIQYV